MNTDTLAGDAQDLGGSAKQAAGDVLGDDRLKSEGVMDQLCGKARAIYGNAKDAAGPAVDKARDAAAPAVDKAKSVAKSKPWATALAAGVVGLAIIGSLRGRGKDA